MAPVLFKTLFDVLTNPLPTTYLTRTLFTIPLATGGIKGIALTQTDAKYLYSAYTLIVSAILSFAWQIVIYLALIFYPTEEKAWSKDLEKDGIPRGDERDQHMLEVRKRKANRYVALVMIWNASSPWTAALQLYGHAFTMIFNANDKATSLYDLIVIFIAITVGVGTAAASTLIPAHLQKGAFAPANPAAVFYLSSVGLNTSDPDYIKYQQTKGPAGQRAMGIVEFANDELANRVNVYPPELMNWTGPNGQRIERVAYDYNVTGLDFGLQLKYPSDFLYSVSGACTLEYNWLDSGASDDLTDVYNLFDSTDFQANVSKFEIFRPTGGIVVYHNSDNDVLANNTYAIVPDTVMRVSLAEGTDPWYETTLNVSEKGFKYYLVKDQRPVLSCWQNDTWSYKGNYPNVPLNLSNLPGLDLSNPLQEILADRLAIPIIRDIGNSLGDSILKSSQGGYNFHLDASIATYTDDLERLIYASYVATQNIFRDTTMINHKYGLPSNAVNSSSGKPILGVGDFVIPSGDVVALSVRNMTIIPIVLVVLWIVRGLASYARYTTKNSGFASRLTLRATALQPVQMYRLLDEQVCGYRDDWFRRKGKLPYVKYAKELWGNLANPPVEQTPPPGDRTATGTAINKTSVNSSVDGTPPLGDRTATGATDDIKEVDASVEEAQTQVDQREVTETTREINSGKPVVNPSPQLFAAPKVVKGPDGKYHLGFTGPHTRMRGKNPLWAWLEKGKGKGSGSGLVVDHPDDHKPGEEKLGFWAKLFSLPATTKGDAVG